MLFVPAQQFPMDFRGAARSGLGVSRASILARLGIPGFQKFPLTSARLSEIQDDRVF